MDIAQIVGITVIVMILVLFALCLLSAVMSHRYFSHADFVDDEHLHKSFTERVREEIERQQNVCD